MATEVPVVLRIFAERSSSVNSVLQDTQKRFNDLAGSVARVAQSTAMMTGGITLALGGVVAAVVRTAGQFEQLQAKLVSVLGSSEAATKAFTRALQVAATTPFDVQGIVQATVTLSAFGQSAQRVLPLVTNLAAAFSENVNEVAMVLGKAFSGSPRGFLSLTNQFGISNLVLQKFGAELTETGAISLRTTGALEKARNALEKIVQTRFGDATARQSATLFGAMSNLGDAIQRTAAAFGSELIPAITAITRSLTSGIEIFERMDPTLRKVVVVGTLAAVAFGGIATAVAAVVSILSSGIGGMIAFGGAVTAAVEAWAGAAGAAGAASFAAAIEGTGAAATVAATGMTSVAVAAPAAATGFTALAGAVLTFLGPIGIAAILIGGVSLLALRNYEQKTKAASAAIAEQSRELTQAHNVFRDHVQLIEHATNSQGKLLAQSGSVSQFAVALRNAFSNVAPNQFLVNLQTAGVTLDGLRKTQEKTRASTDEFKDKVNTLSGALDILEQRKVHGHYFDLVTSEEQATLAQAEKILGGLPLTIDNVSSSLGTARVSFSEYLKTALGISTVIEKTQEYAASFDAVSAKAESLQLFLQFATKPDNVDALDSAFGVLQGRIGEIEGELSRLGVPMGSVAALQMRLLTGTDEEKKSVSELLKLYESRENIEKKREGLGDKAIQDKIRTAEAGIEKETILRGESKAAEIKIYQELLGIVRAGSAEELTLLTKIAGKKQALKREEVAGIKQTLTELAGSSNAGLEKLRATGETTATETAKALEGVLANLDAWGIKNAALIAQQPKLAQEFKNVVAGFQTRLDTANLEKPKEQLKAAVAAAKEFGTEAVSNTEKLRAAQQGLALLENLQATGQIRTRTEKAALQTEINRLTKEEVTLQHAVTKEQDAQAAQTAGLRREGLSQELELLKAQQEVLGNTPFLQTQIADKERQILAGRIQAIREQEKAEIDSGATVEQAHERAEIRITQFKNEETLKRIKLEEAQTKAVDDEAKKQQAIKEGFEKNRLGGVNSPLQSQAEVSATSGLFGNFSLGSFGDGFGRSAGRRSGFGAPPQTLGRIRGKIDADIKQGETRPGNQNIPGTPMGDATKAGNSATGSAEQAGTQTVNQYNLGVSGYPIDSPEVQQAVRKIVDTYIADKNFKKGSG